MEREHLGEWLANAISHGVGFILTVVAFIVLLVNAQTTAHRVAVTIYGLSLMMLYLFSTLYHALPSHKPNIYYLFKRFDHMAIYLLIAGTYTPMVWIVLNNTQGFILLGILWSLALLGIILKAIWIRRFSVIHVIIYLLMGWSVMVIWPSIGPNLSDNAMLFLIFGGVAYSVGVIFYALSRKKRYMHFIWHLFVLTGSLLHVMAVYNIL